MKKLLSFALMLMVCIAANAQDGVSAESYEAMAKNTTVALPIISTENYQNAFTATAPQSVLTQNYENDPAYRKAKGWRTAGIVTTCAAGAACAYLTAMGIAGANEDNQLGGAISEAVALTYGIPAGVLTVAGVVTWIVSNNKMKNIKAASSGLGLAFEF